MAHSSHGSFGGSAFDEVDEVPTLESVIALSRFLRSLARSGRTGEVALCRRRIGAPEGNVFDVIPGGDVGRNSVSLTGMEGTIIARGVLAECMQLDGWYAHRLASCHRLARCFVRVKITVRPGAALDPAVLRMFSCDVRMCIHRRDRRLSRVCFVGHGLVEIRVTRCSTPCKVGRNRMRWPEPAYGSRRAPPAGSQIGHVVGLINT